MFFQAQTHNAVNWGWLTQPAQVRETSANRTKWERAASSSWQKLTHETRMGSQQQLRTLTTTWHQYTRTADRTGEKQQQDWLANAPTANWRTDWAHARAHHKRHHCFSHQSSFDWQGHDVQSRVDERGCNKGIPSRALQQPQSPVKSRLARRGTEVKDGRRDASSFHGIEACRQGTTGSPILV